MSPHFKTAYRLFMFIERLNDTARQLPEKCLSKHGTGTIFSYNIKTRN